MGIRTKDKGFCMAISISNLSRQKPAVLRLLGYSFLILFFELALIRFIPANVRVAAYFINMVLIAAFLGMGVGLILQARRFNFVFLFTPTLLILTLACWYFSNTIVEAPASSTEQFFAIYYDVSPTAKKWGTVPVVSLLFALSAFVFVPLGLAMGREFEKFPPLIAYCINIFGSLLGMSGFAMLSYYSTPPLVWFGLGIIGYILLSSEKRDRIVSFACFPLIMVFVFLVYHPKNEIWSPYYKINLIPKSGATIVNVNGSLHQYMIDFSEDIMAKNPDFKLAQEDFLRPYKLIKKLDNILIVGSGTGNDVVMALKQNARHIDAVEIDRQILEIGRKMNPQRPYDDPRVSVHIDDARAYLKKTDHKYDLIVLGTLDSQTLLSGMSSIRLDNYVYTLEAFQSFKEHLQPEGILILHHMSITNYISYKIYLTLTKAFGAPPLVNVQKPHRLFNFTFVAGAREKDSPDFPTVFQLPEAREEITKYSIPIDDWPYLYLSHPTIPEHYLWTGGIIAVFSLVLMVFALGRENIGKPDGTLFFLGAGFLLLETKSVTEMSLLFGSTWQVNVLVFFSILVLILAANLLVLNTQATAPERMDSAWTDSNLVWAQFSPGNLAPASRWPEIKNHLLFIILFGLVALYYVIPVQNLLGLPLMTQWVLGGIRVALPLFFAGILFARIFKTRRHPVKSLGFNLIGSILGGLLEYSSMAFGTKSLYIVSLLMYFMAYYCFNRESKDL